jgi:hypothetical protein
MENSASQQSGPAVPLSPPKILTQEEKNDLRKKVLSGQALTIEEARDVVHSLRVNSAAALVASEPKKRTGGAKKSMSDEDLDAALNSVLDL